MKDLRAATRVLERLGAMFEDAPPAEGLRPAAAQRACKRALKCGTRLTPNPSAIVGLASRVGADV